MCFCVSVQVGLLAKASPTLLAHIRLLSGVCPLVMNKDYHQAKASATLTTHIKLLHCVCPMVSDKVSLKPPPYSLQT